MKQEEVRLKRKISEMTISQEDIEIQSEDSDDDSLYVLRKLIERKAIEVDFNLLDSNDLSKQIGDDAINRKCNDSISSCSVMSI